MRPIDADELIDHIKDELYDNAGYWYKMIADALIKVIQSIPTIGSEPDHDDDIVRCTRCPFCGSTARRLFVVPFSGDYDKPDGWYVCCEPSDYGCGATGPAMSTQHDAIEEWNKRAIFDEIKNKVQKIYDDGGTYDDLDALRAIVKIVMEEVPDE